MSKEEIEEFLETVDALPGPMSMVERWSLSISLWIYDEDFGTMDTIKSIHVSFSSSPITFMIGKLATRLNKKN